MHYSTYIAFTGEHRFLSNFYVHPVVYGGITYKTSEHAYQAAKATNDYDRYFIIDAQTPGHAKRLGRDVPIRSDWEKVKYNIMLEIVRCKFNDLDLAQRLIATGNQPLIEVNTWGDKYWGCIRRGNIADVTTFEGENNLGKILMKVRDEVKDFFAALRLDR